VRKLLQTGGIVEAQQFGMVWIISDEIVIESPSQTEHRIKKLEPR
jgi:hypothetical protein